MTGLYPEIEPYDRGMLEVGDGDLVYWETCGSRRGKPAVVLHGGPGSGCTNWHRRLFDPRAYRIVLFDQRGCGRSTPPASAPDTDLASNNTLNLMADLELLRQHLDIDRWLVLGGSWGSTLALAYTEMHPGPDYGDDLVRRHDGTTQGVRLVVPRRCGYAVPRAVGASPRCRAGSRARWGYRRGIPPIAARSRPRGSPASRRRVVYVGVRDPRVAPGSSTVPPVHGSCLRDGVCGLVTHYVRHDAWLEDGALLRGAGSLAGIPGILVQGRLDFQAPIAWAWDLNRVWPRAALVVVGNAGHAPDSLGITEELVRSTDQFATHR